MFDLFERCRLIAAEIDNGNESKAREDLLLLLDECQRKSISYTPFLNHLIRQLGLFPYMKDDAIWQDRVVRSFFSTDVGSDGCAVLHIDQSNILRKLLEGRNLLVSAPTSFGKSFIIDAYIATKKPNNVVVIVPTVALTDETRRRLHNKFGSRYNIITQADQEIKERNIFVFPQERAFSYLGKFPEIDILIVDEFYKASSSFSDERYAALVKIIVELKKISKQSYFIAPDFTLDPNENPLTKGMSFLDIKRNTVYTEIHEDYKDISNSRNKREVKKTKERRLVELLSSGHKTLVYAGDPANIKQASRIVLNNLGLINSSILDSFSSYLSEQYGSDYALCNLVRRGVGIHDGKIHRPLAQLQIKLFSEEAGLNAIISSSSIIEGVNTSAENVVLWSNKIAKRLLSSYSYNNIVGRAGRMFKYFVGRVFLLESPPEVIKPQTLSLEYTDEVISSIDETDWKNELTKEQIARISHREIEFDRRWGSGLFRKIRSVLKDNIFNIDQVSVILEEMTEKTDVWNDKNLNRFLNFDTKNWSFRITSSIARHINLHEYRPLAIIQAMALNWDLTVPEIIKRLPEKLQNDRAVEKYFELERKITYKFANALSVFVSIYNCLRGTNIDLSSPISRIASAFLPKVVYQLEEYGLPRSLSKKITDEGLIVLDDPSMTITKAISSFKEIGKDRLYNAIPSRHDFEKYILDYFYSGI